MPSAESAFGLYLLFDFHLTNLKTLCLYRLFCYRITSGNSKLVYLGILYFGVLTSDSPLLWSNLLYFFLYFADFAHFLAVMRIFDRPVLSIEVSTRQLQPVLLLNLMHLHHPPGPGSSSQTNHIIRQIKFIPGQRYQFLQILHLDFVFFRPIFQY